MYKRGFTLVELIVVIAIIGILSSIIIVGLNEARQSGRDAKRVADIKNIQLALQLYFGDQSPPKYPTSLDALEPIYMSKVPKDYGNTAYLYHASALSSSGGLGITINCSGSIIPIFYHLGAVMEAGDSALLSQDRDLPYSTDQDTYRACNGGTSVKFDGNATACAGASAVSPDNCYDVVPN